MAHCAPYILIRRFEYDFQLFGKPKKDITFAAVLVDKFEIDCNHIKKC